MKKFLGTIINGCSALLGAVVYLFLLGPVFGKAYTKASIATLSTDWTLVEDFESLSFYKGLGEKGYGNNFKGLGIAILVILGVAVVCTLFLIALDLLKAKKIKFLNFVPALLFVAAGVLVFFLGNAASGTATAGSGTISVGASVKYSIGACTVFAGIFAIVAGLVVAVAPLFSKKGK